MLSPPPSPALSVLTLRSLITRWGPFCHLSLLGSLENPCVSLRPGPLPGRRQSDASPASLGYPCVVLTQGHCQPELCRIPCPGISSDNPAPFHPSTADKPRGLSPLEATSRLRVVIRHPWKSSRQEPAALTCISPASHSLPTPGGIGPEAKGAHSSRNAGSWWPDPTHRGEACPDPYPCLRPRWPPRRSPWPDAARARGGRCG